jgi:hypothetical protein
MKGKATMNPIRHPLVLSGLVLAGGFTLVWSQYKVVVAGDPPLTESLFEKRKRPRRMGAWQVNG